jgi:hypothetical protein
MNADQVVVRLRSGEIGSSFSTVSRAALSRSVIEALLDSGDRYPLALSTTLAASAILEALRW